MTVYIIAEAVLELDGEVITTRFSDGSSCVFAPPHEHDDTAQPVLASFVAAAHEMGYSDLTRYAVEHELAHHFVVQQFNMKNRHVLYRGIPWDAAHNVPMSLDEPERAAEEHLANHLQKYVNLGTPDPYGCLEAHFGPLLWLHAQNFIMLARPWLTVKR